jgi:hypothetical protein
MLETLRPSGFRIRMDPFLVTALMSLLTAATLGVVALLAMGRLGVLDAIFFAAVPWVLLAATFRPDWLLLGFIAMPATVTADIPTRRVLALVGVAFVMLLITRRSFSMGLGTSLAALLIINVAGRLFEAEVDSAAIAVNRETMLNLTLYIALALLAFNLAVLGELDGGRLATALVIGVVTTLVVGWAGHGGIWFESGPGIVTKTRLGAMASAALGVSLARLLMVEDTPRRRLGNLLMSGILIWLTIASDTRATWIAAAITLGLLAFRLRRRGYVLILMVVILLALLAPVGRQAITRSESGDLVAEFRTGDITTGRWKLWTELWDRAQPALPWGNGFGYVWSLSAQDLFGLPGGFHSEESGVVPPHNDFIYMLVEFGVPGLLLLIVFWVGVFRARGLVSRSTDPLLRQSGWLLLGAIVTGLAISLFDDIFSVRPLAERFFPVAGLLFGLAAVERTRRRDRPRLESTRTIEATPAPVP